MPRIMSPMTRLLPGVAAILVMMTTAACGQATAPPAPDLTVHWQLVPAAPVVGRELVADVTLRRPDGSHVVAARLNLEGHMTHPGMAPVIAPLTETGSGRYRATLTLTMAGEWVMLVRGELSDGQRVQQRVADVVAAAAE
jgi:hypothetical protein